MTEKRYDVIYEKEPRGQVVTDNGIPCTARTCCTRLNRLEEENEDLKQSYKEFEDECQSTFNAMSRKQNDLYRKNFKLKEENEQLKDALNQRTDQCDKYYKENEQLKIRFKEERERALKFGRDIDTLTVKNEQLKQFQDSVFSWIDMHLQRLPTLRDDEFESDNEFADPSLYSGAIQILETMKRELKGDFE